MDPAERVGQSRSAQGIERDGPTTAAHRQAHRLQGARPDYADSLPFETGTRPGTKSPTGVKRPYARVIAGSENAAEQEFGGKNMPKRGFLRRAAAELGESVAR